MIEYYSFTNMLLVVILTIMALAVYAIPVLIAIPMLWWAFDKLTICYRRFSWLK